MSFSSNQFQSFLHRFEFLYYRDLLQTFLPQTTRQTVAAQVALQKRLKTSKSRISSSKWHKKLIHWAMILTSGLLFLQALSLHQRFKQYFLIKLITQKVDHFDHLLIGMVAGNTFIALCLCPMPLFYVAYDRLLFSRQKSYPMWTVVHKMLEIEDEKKERKGSFSNSILSFYIWQPFKETFFSKSESSSTTLLVPQQKSWTSSLKKTTFHNVKQRFQLLWKLSRERCKNDSTLFTTLYQYRPFVSKQVRAQMALVSAVMDKLETVLLLVYGKQT